MPSDTPTRPEEAIARVRELTDEVIRAAQSLGMSLGEDRSEGVIAGDAAILHDRRTALLAYADALAQELHEERTLGRQMNEELAAAHGAISSLTAEVVQLRGRDEWAQREFKRWAHEYAVWTADHTRLSAERDLAQAELAALRERLARAEEAINWACGTGDSDFEEPENAKRYWWRKQLTEKAGLAYDPSITRYIAARRPDPTEGTPDATPARLPRDAHG